jgi:hypothetical protein
MSHARQAVFTYEADRGGMESIRRVPAILLAAILTVITLSATASASALVQHPGPHHHHAPTRLHQPTA